MRAFPLESSISFLSATFKKNNHKHGPLYLVDIYLHTSILHGYFLSLADLALRGSRLPGAATTTA